MKRSGGVLAGEGLEVVIASDWGWENVVATPHLLEGGSLSGQFVVHVKSCRAGS